jgi:hypothetical protein
MLPAGKHFRKSAPYSMAEKASVGVRNLGIETNPSSFVFLITFGFVFGEIMNFPPAEATSFIVNSPRSNQ